MFELTVHGHFDAAHYLKEYQGKCARVHGHTWRVEVKVRGNTIDQTGMLMDFSLIKKKLRVITDQFDHILLNDLSCFEKMNPTAENISRYIYDDMVKSLAEYKVKVASVTVWESPDAAATYSQGE